MNNELVESGVKLAHEKQHTRRDASGPGRRLHAARLAANISIESVAGALHLTTQMVADLEEDNYVRFAGHTFVRGYLRNYAKLLKLSPEEMIAEFNNLGVAEQESDKPKLSLKTVCKPHRFSRFKVLAIMVVTLIFVIVAVSWFARNHRHPLTADIIKQPKPELYKLQPTASGTVNLSKATQLVIPAKLNGLTPAKDEKDEQVNSIGESNVQE